MSTATPTDLPKGSTVNVPCLCGPAWLVYANQDCYRHGQENTIAVAATLLRQTGAQSALNLIRSAA